MALAAATTSQGQSRVDADTQLARSVRQFLDAWLIRSAPKEAAGMLSTLVKDERLVPAEWYSAAAYRERFGGPQANAERPISWDVARARFAEYLDRTLRSEPLPRFESVDTLLLPLAPADAQKVDPQLWRIVAPREPRTLPQLAVLAYGVRSWDDVSWTASGTVGYRMLLPALIDRERLDVQAVVMRLRLDLPTPALLFTLWSRPQTMPTAAWSLLGVDIPPSQ
jgi:hypothetical protein